MSGLGLIAVTHAHAPLEILEGVSYVGEDVAASLNHLRKQVGIKDAAILTTCNRTEIYAVFDGPADPSRLAWFLSQDRHICWGRIRDHIDEYTDDAAVAHLFRVAAGVDSLAFGEAEIVAQIKTVHAELKAATRHELLGLFEAAIRASRAVRANVDLDEAGASLGTAAVAAARVADKSTARIFVVGAGKIARSVLAALPESADIAVASRTFTSAETLVRGRGRAVPMDDFAGELAVADAVFFCASSKRPILDAAAADAVTSARTSPLVAVDLGLPRNVAAEVKIVDGIEVIDLDGLRSHTSSTERMRILTQVEPIIGQEVARYRAAAIGRSVAPVIDELRATVAALAAAEVHRAFPREGSERARSEQVVRKVVGRLLHGAITEIRGAAVEGDVKTLTRLARAFGSQISSFSTDVSVQISHKEEVA